MSAVNGPSDIGASPQPTSPRPTRPVTDPLYIMRPQPVDAPRKRSGSFSLIRAAPPPSKVDATPLLDAVNRGNAQQVMQLLSLNIPYDFEQREPRSGQSLLFLAIGQRHEGLVGALLPYCDCNAKDPGTQETALHVASYSLSQVVPLLLGRGAALDCVDARGLTPLAIAVQIGQLDLVERYLRAGATFKGRDREEKSVLEKALSRVVECAEDDRANSLRISEVLLQAGADPDEPFSTGQLALHFAWQHHAHDLMRLLLRFDASPSKTDAEKISPLYRSFAYRSSDRTSYELFLNAHPNLSAQLSTQGNSTLLHLCVRHNDRPSAEELLRRRTSVGVKDNSHRTPLQLAYACYQRQLKQLLPWVVLLLRYGADARQKEGEQLSFLELCQAHSSEEDMQPIIRACTETLPLPQPPSSSSLHQAISEGDLSRVRELLRTGTDPNTENQAGESALLIAVKTADIAPHPNQIASSPELLTRHQDRLAIVEQLLLHGARKNVVLRKVFPTTPLIMSCRERRPEVTRLLLKYGASVNLWAGGLTPLGEAKQAIRIDSSNPQLQPIIDQLTSLGAQDRSAPPDTPPPSPSARRPRPGSQLVDRPVDPSLSPSTSTSPRPVHRSLQQVSSAMVASAAALRTNQK